MAFKEHCGKDTWNCLAEDLKHGLKPFPDDVDTTSVALLTLNLELKTIEFAMHKILRNVDRGGDDGSGGVLHMRSCLHKQIPFVPFFVVVRSNHFGLRRYRLILRPIFVVVR